MDEGRLLYLKKVIKLRQKCAAAVNDKIKEKLRVVTESLDKEKKSISYKRSQDGGGLKWSYTRGRGLLKCLQEIPEDENSYTSPPRFGRYNGAPLTSFRRQVEGHIAFNHPKERRKRQIDQIKNNCEQYGILTDYSAVGAKLGNILESPSKYKIELADFVRPKAKRPVMLRKRPAANQRAQLRLPPITVKRLDFGSSPSLTAIASVSKNSVPSIGHSRSSTLLSF